MTTDTPTTDTRPEPLWMRCSAKGDEFVRWEDLTDAEQLQAIEFHNTLYGIES